MAAFSQCWLRLSALLRTLSAGWHLHRCGNRYSSRFAWRKQAQTRSVLTITQTEPGLGPKRPGSVLTSTQHTRKTEQARAGQLCPGSRPLAWLQHGGARHAGWRSSRPTRGRRLYSPHLHPQPGRSTCPSSKVSAAKSEMEAMSHWRMKVSRTASAGTDPSGGRASCGAHTGASRLPGLGLGAVGGGPGEVPSSRAPGTWFP